MNERYNKFFVKCFNLILKKEEAMLKQIDANLSMTEIHVIEAVYNAGADNSSKNVAHALGISLGTLTTSVKTLIEKGYLEKQKDKNDKRVSRLFLTEKGKQANESHLGFHAAMIRELLDGLDEERAAILLDALEKLSKFLGEFNYES